MFFNLFQVVAVNVRVQGVKAGEHLGTERALNTGFAFAAGGFFSVFLRCMSTEAGFVSKVEVTLRARDPFLLDSLDVVLETMLVQVQHVLVGAAAVAAGELP